MNYNSNIIKKELSKYSFGENPFIDDAIIKGGYRVVRTVKERNDIDCCHRKLGMRVMVIGQDYSYKDYILKGENICSNDHWQLAGNGSGEIDTINDSDVTLLDDYSDLDITKDIRTQQDLNQVLYDLLITILGNQIAGDKNYVHDQFTPSATWTIFHTLNKRASVTIVDTAGSEMEGAIKYYNDNHLVVTFNFPFSGYAYLN